MTNITIIGYGTMGKAIAKQLSKDSKINIFTIDINKKNTTGIKKSDFIILAVKPQDGSTVIEQLKSYGINKKTILISIMAGFSIKKILNLSEHKKIIRMMPNLGLSAGEGIAVWKKTGLSPLETKKSKNFINKITENFEVQNEDTINKVTAISGSGPAYFFLLADCLVKTSQSLGFTKNESQKLVEKTFLASAKLGQNSDYSSLIEKIASKGGTTESALKVFKNENFTKIVSEAVISAYKKAKELESITN
ncbi:MAG: pyrroline-5-carboxylate reductase dimerization domain-containing protein [Candidatus Paceibacterota bacterium]|jgi:pyrroline-5-carboxylate reductase